MCRNDVFSYRYFLQEAHLCLIYLKSWQDTRTTPVGGNQSQQSQPGSDDVLKYTFPLYSSLPPMWTKWFTHSVLAEDPSCNAARMVCCLHLAKGTWMLDGANENSLVGARVLLNSTPLQRKWSCLISRLVETKLFINWKLFNTNEHLPFIETIGVIYH